MAGTREKRMCVWGGGEKGGFKGRAFMFCIVPFSPSKNIDDATFKRLPPGALNRAMSSLSPPETAETSRDAPSLEKKRLEAPNLVRRDRVERLFGEPPGGADGQRGRDRRSPGRGELPAA